MVHRFAVTAEMDRWRRGKISQLLCQRCKGFERHPADRFVPGAADAGFAIEIAGGGDFDVEFGEGR